MKPALFISAARAIFLKNGSGTALWSSIFGLLYKLSFLTGRMRGYRRTRAASGTQWRDRARLWFDLGRPVRHPVGRAATLRTGQWARFATNARHTNYAGQYYWKDIFNMAFGSSLPPDMFLRRLLYHQLFSQSIDLAHHPVHRHDPPCQQTGARRGKQVNRLAFQQDRQHDRCRSNET